MSKIYNTHVHLFTAAFVPPGFYGRKVKSIFESIKWLTPVRETLLNLLKWINPFNFYDEGNRLANMVRTGALDSQQEVLDELRAYYKNDPNMAYVVLSVDMDYMGAGIPDLNYKTQLEELTQLKYQNQHDIIPFVCVDPRRHEGEKLVEFVKDYIEDKGFGGIKMYPALGFYPFDSRLHELYKYAQEEEIPIITHCDRGGIHYQGDENPISRLKLISDLQKIRSLPTDANLKIDDFLLEDKFHHNFSNPMGFYEVLRAYPKLKICFAHFGGGDEFNCFIKSDRKLKESSNNIGAFKEFTKPNEIEIDQMSLAKPPYLFRYPGNPIPNLSWMEQIAWMVSHFTNAYTDISYTLSDKKYFKQIGSALDLDKVGGKILFGTDFYLVEREKPEDMIVKDYKESLAMKDYKLRKFRFKGLSKEQKSTMTERFEKLASKNPERFLKIKKRTAIV